MSWELAQRLWVLPARDEVLAASDRTNPFQQKGGQRLGMGFSPETPLSPETLRPPDPENVHGGATNCLALARVTVPQHVFNCCLRNPLQVATGVCGMIPIPLCSVS